jgi:hypothetical protein
MKMSNRLNVFCFSALAAAYMLVSAQPALASGADSGGTKAFMKSSCMPENRTADDPHCRMARVEAPPEILKMSATVTRRHNHR